MAQSNKPLVDKYRQADKIMLPVIWLLFVVALALTPWYATYTPALVVGLPAAFIPTILFFLSPGTRLTRSVVAVSLMVFSALHIHQAAGVTELHFGIFVLLAVLLCYRDWFVIVVAAAVIAVHHLSFNYLQELGWGVYCFTETGFQRVLVHAAYVVVETIALCIIAEWMRRDALQAAELQNMVRELGTDTHRINLSTAGQNRNSPAAQALGQALEAASSAIGRVNSGVHGIDAAGDQLVATTNQVQSGAQQQAQAAASALHTIRETSDAVQENQRHATEAATKVQAASHLAHQGSEAMGQAVSTMRSINGLSARIAEITGVIDSIAFQTNILALNAAVEAARAGEQGRGFAVVASEVRSLAQRSAGAAREIKELIEDSVNQIADGTTLVERTGGLMQELSEGVQAVAHAFAEFTQASQQQGERLLQVGRSVNDINAIVERNLTQVETMRASVTSLEDESRGLAEAVAVFQLGRSTHRQPTPALTG